MLTPGLPGAADHSSTLVNGRAGKALLPSEQRVEPGSAAEGAEVAAVNEESAEASFPVLFAWLSGTVPSAPRLPADPAGGATPGTGLPLQAATTQGQSLPPGGNTLPLLPQELLHPGQTPAQENAHAEGLTDLTDVQAELARRAPVSMAASALLAHAHDAEPKSTRANSSALDLSFLSSPISQSSAPAAAEGNRSPAGNAAGVNSATNQAGQPQLENAMGQRVVWMVQQGIHDARVRVHPEHLGPIEIRLKLEGDVAQVTFHSPHSAVRDALTEAVPRLREMMGDAGLSLSQVDVDAGGSHPRQSRHADAFDQEPGVTSDGETELVEADVRSQSLARGLVDTFA